MTETAEVTKKKSALDSARGTIYRLDPDNLVLVGRDKREVYTDLHPLAKGGQAQRSQRDLNVRRVLNMLLIGFTTVIDIVKGAGPGAIPWPSGSQDDFLVVKGRGRTIDARMAKAIIKKFIEVYSESSTVEQISKDLTAFAGFEIPPSVVRAMIARGVTVDTILVKCELVRGDAGALMGRAAADNAAALRDPDLDPYDQALSMQDYIDAGKDFGRDEDNAAVEFGVSIDTVRNRLKLLNAAPESVAAAKKGEVTWSDVMGAVGLPQEQQIERLAATPKKAPGQKRRSGRRGEQRRPGKRTAERIVEFLGPGHDVSKFWAFMSGAPGGVEGVCKIDKGVKEIVQPEKKVKVAKAKGTPRKKKAAKK